MLTRGLAAERGSVTVYTVVFAIAVIFLLGLIVDGGNALNARERALDIAGQAARAAADDLNLAALRSGQVWMAAGACAAAASTATAYAKALTGGKTATLPMTARCQPETATGAPALPGTPAATVAKVTVTLTTQPLVPVTPGGFTVTETQTATVKCGIRRGGNCP